MDIPRKTVDKQHTTEHCYSEYELILTDDVGNRVAEVGSPPNLIAGVGTPDQRLEVGTSDQIVTCSGESDPIVYDESGAPKFYAVVTDGGMMLVPIADSSITQRIINVASDAVTSSDRDGVVYVESRPDERVCHQQLEEKETFNVLHARNFLDIQVI